MLLRCLKETLVPSGRAEEPIEFSLPRLGHRACAGNHADWTQSQRKEIPKVDALGSTKDLDGLPIDLQAIRIEEDNCTFPEPIPGVRPSNQHVICITADSFNPLPQIPMLGFDEIPKLREP